MRKFLFLIPLLICTSVFAQSRRVALIIGNEKYDGHFSKLYTPENDAVAMNNILQKLGFETIIGKNVKRDSMSYYVEKFAKLANGAEVSLFYYSGHAGIGKNDEFFLAPSGSYRSAETLTEDCYSLLSIENRMKKISSPTKIYIFDACRNSIDGSKDMVRVTPTSLAKNSSNTRGTIYCFATGVNKTAQTGVGKYSIFTESLLNHIGDFDNLLSVWGKISDEVTRANSEQVPHLKETTEGLSRNTYLNPNKVKIYKENIDGLDTYSIVTTPSDATIVINGATFKSNDKMYLEYGKEYEMSISAKGYATYNSKITATPYKTTYIISLDKLARTTLNIQCNVMGATVFFDGDKIGTSPIDKILTYAGTHDIRIEKEGYNSYIIRPLLKGGEQTVTATITKIYPWFISWNDIGLNLISYHYSSKYPISLSYLYRFDESRFSLGALFGFSTGLFRGLGLSTSVETTSESGVTVVDNGNNVGYKSSITSTSYEPDEYTEDIDPDHEATHYDSNFMFLITGGYQPCNGMLLETGLGVASHCDKYYLPYSLSQSRTVTTNLSTGEIVGEPTYNYVRGDGSTWIKEKVKWSPAMRLGVRFFVPFNDKDNIISLGCGYTYLFNNNKYSSFDVNIGIGWTF